MRVEPRTLMSTVLKEMYNQKSQFDKLGFIIVTEGDTVRGILSRGDLIKLFSDNSTLDQPISNIMNRNPIVYQLESATSRLIGSDLIQYLEQINPTPSIIIVVDKNHKYICAVDTLSVLTDHKRVTEVSIYGMGFVGLTLAVAFANVGYRVIGIDTNQKIIEELLSGKIQIHEEGLEPALHIAQNKESITFSLPDDRNSSNIHIIAVGTPVYNDVADVKALQEVCGQIGKVLKIGDCVILRSTVPAGTCRNLVVRELEQHSGLGCGDAFHLAFAPERTVEGHAYQELHSLPQLVGGFSEKCASVAGQIFSKLTSKIVVLDSLEEAEFCKLLNNSYRDLTFSFSNAFAMSVAQLGYDANRILTAAGYDYVRGKIPSAGPGVGGYCLTKDPTLLQLSFGKNSQISNFTKLSRTTNDASKYLPVHRLREYTNNYEITEKMKVLIVGAAFKGKPETNDLRGSTSLDVGEILETQGEDVYYLDMVVSEHTLAKKGLKTPKLEGDFFDAILVLNNHPKNFSAIEKYLKTNNPIFICDSWSLAAPNNFPDNVFYSSLTKNYWN